MTGIYDLKEDRLRKLDGTTPLSIETSPIRPDGKGFLVQTESDNKGPPALAFMDWDGNKEVVDMDDAFKNNRDHTPDKWEVLGLSPFFSSSWWEKDTAVVRSSTMCIRIDTRARKGTLQVVQPERTADGKIIDKQYQFPDGGAVVRVVELKTKKELKEDPFEYRLEVIPPGKNGSQMLVAKATHYVILLPAPDKKMLALEYTEPAQPGPPATKERRAILVVDRAGKPLARLTEDGVVKEK